MKSIGEIITILSRYGWVATVDDGCVMVGDHILCFTDELLVGYYDSLFRRCDDVTIKENSITVMCMGDCIARITKTQNPCVFA